MRKNCALSYSALPNGRPARNISFPARVLSALAVGALSGLFAGLLFSVLVFDSLAAFRSGSGSFRRIAFAVTSSAPSRGPRQPILA